MEWDCGKERGSEARATEVLSGLDKDRTHIWSSGVNMVTSLFRRMRGYCWHGSIWFIFLGKRRISQVQLCAACVGSLVSRHLCDSDSGSSVVLFLEYAVLDDMATTWFFHYVRCYSLCVLAINDMVCNLALSLDWRGTRCLGTNAYLRSALELTELIASTTRLLFATCERHQSETAMSVRLCSIVTIFVFFGISPCERDAEITTFERCVQTSAHNFSDSWCSQIHSVFCSCYCVALAVVLLGLPCFLCFRAGLCWLSFFSC